MVVEHRRSRWSNLTMGRPAWTTQSVVLAFALLSVLAPGLAAFAPPAQGAAPAPLRSPGSPTGIHATQASSSIAPRLSELPRQSSLPTAIASSFGVAKTFTVGSSPTGIAYDSAKGEEYIANSNGTNVTVYSDATGRTVASIAVGPFPYQLAYDSGKGEMFVIEDTNVTVISDTTNLVVATIHLGGGPAGITYDSGKGEVFVANFYLNRVSVISDTTNRVVANVTVTNGTAAAYDHGLGEVFVTSWPVGTSRGFVTVISDATNMVVRTIPVGARPYSLAWDPANGDVYVANLGNNNVSVVADSSNTVVATIPVGTGPIGVAYDSRAGDVFVANSGSDNVSVISEASNTVVQSVGNLLGAGAYAATYDPGIDAVFVVDSSANLISVIVRGYSVGITETGLPTGTQWQVGFTGTNAYGSVNTTYLSLGSSVSAFLPNGSYSFTVPPVSGFREAPSTGTFTVAGSPVSQAVVFRELFTVTFHESGLAAGTGWSVTLNGTLNHSTTSTATFIELNGTYSFTVGAVSGYLATTPTGIVTVSGTKSVTITFETTYAIAFTETGLASGTNWSITLGGSALSSLTASITFVEANGTYTYTLGVVPGWTTSSYVGAVSVAGSALSKIVAWQQATYSVTFAETGLPLGTTWSVTLNSATVSGVGDLSFPGTANGTYTYTVGAVTGFSPLPSSGSVKVTGPASPISIVFGPSASSSSTGSTFLGLPATEGYGLLGGIIVVVVGAGLALAMRGRGPKTPPASAPPPSSPAPPATGAAPPTPP